jgi:hypothetical protein
MDAAVSSLTYSPEQVIGKAFDLDPAKLFVEANQAAVELGSAMLYIQMHLQGKDRMVVLVADLGPLPATQRNDLHQQMLVANNSWRDLAGGALCTDDSGERAFLRLQLDLDTLDGESLAQWTGAFAVAAVAWAKRVAAAVSPPETHAPLPEFMSPPRDFPGFSPFNRA